jgi:hypothetical protein
MTSAYLIPTVIICDSCHHAFERSLHDVGWINAIECPKCSKRVQLEAGPNAAAISRAMNDMVAQDSAKSK